MSLKSNSDAKHLDHEGFFFPLWKKLCSNLEVVDAGSQKSHHSGQIILSSPPQRPSPSSAI